MKHAYKAVQGAQAQDDNQGPGFISGSRDPTSLKQRSDVVFHCPIQRQTRSCPVAEHLKVGKNQVVQMLLKQDCGACWVNYSLETDLLYPATGSRFPSSRLVSTETRQTTQLQFSLSGPKSRALLHATSCNSVVELENLWERPRACRPCHIGRCHTSRP